MITSFLMDAKNRADLYHVGAPLIMAMAMSTSSFGGALLFLLAWGLIRGMGYG